MEVEGPAFADWLVGNVRSGDPLLHRPSSHKIARKGSKHFEKHCEIACETADSLNMTNSGKRADLMTLPSAVIRLQV